MIRKITAIGLMLLLGASVLTAKITMPPYFTDGMVLQRNSQMPMRGTAKPGKKVTVLTSWDAKTYETQAAADGSWSVRISTPEAGGPYSVTISDGKKLEISNVLIGDVWLCGGQSNMEMPVRGGWAGINDYQKVLADASNHQNVRLFHVDKKIGTRPATEVTVRENGWMVPDSLNLKEFSACGWFFGKDLNESLDIPIGLIESCWGGTRIETWVSGEGLQDEPVYQEDLERLATIPEDKAEADAYWSSLLDEWKVNMAKCDKAYTDGKLVWGSNDYDDTSWKDIQIGSYLQPQGIEDAHGFFWLRKTVDIPESWVGHDLTLHVGVVDDFNYTYFNGVEVGHEDAMVHSEYPVPADIVKAGKNTIAVRVMDTGGMSGILGDGTSICIALNDNDKIALDGTWKYRCSLESISEAPAYPTRIDDAAVFPSYPSSLYNAMIAPLKEYPIAGAIWYQGESNTSDAVLYRDMLPLLIRDWRHQWGKEFPFYIVQIANYMDHQTGPETSEWAMLREAELMAARNVTNTGLAVTIDIGEEFDIHPKNKAEVGRRLALNALAGNYGKKVEYQGPLYESCIIDDSKMILSFSHAESGLKARDGGKLEGFYIAGGDHVFHAADATIEGNRIIVSSKDVAYPVAVRYAWANNPVCNLINGEGLPASPFRTDIWEK